MKKKKRKFKKNWSKSWEFLKNNLWLPLSNESEICSLKWTKPLKWTTGQYWRSKIDLMTQTMTERDKRRSIMLIWRSRRSHWQIRAFQRTRSICLKLRDRLSDPLVKRGSARMQTRVKPSGGKFSTQTVCIKLTRKELRNCPPKWNEMRWLARRDPSLKRKELTRWRLK